MSELNLAIDGQQLAAGSGMSIFEAAAKAVICILGLCTHPDLPPSTELRTLMRMPLDCYNVMSTHHPDYECSGIKQAKESQKWGLPWESITARSLVLAGADILVLRHPKAVN